MRMSSTTVPTSFEHESMMTFRLRTTSINSFSVSMPFISGISTSRMMKSGRSPFFTFSRASLPELTVSTAKPSTSSRVCKYLRILGSSSTTRIRSFGTIGSSLSTKKSQLSPLIHGQQKRKLASRAGVALDPDFAAVRLDEPLGDRQAQAHAGSIAVHSHKVLENFLMMLGRDTCAGILNADFNAVWPGEAKPAAFFHRRHRGDPALPKMWRGAQGHCASTGGVLQRVIQEICCSLLHLLVIEPERRDGWVDVGFQTNTLALKGLGPTLGKFVQAITQVILAELQNQFAAFERGIIEEHGNETHEALATFSGFLENVSLLIGQAAKRTCKEKIVIAFDDSQRCFQLVRGVSQEHSLLTINFLKLQVRGEKIAIGDLAFLKEFLYGELGCRISFGFAVNFQHQPIRLRHPLNPA